MMELEELERRELIERHTDDMIGQNVADNRTLAQLLRAYNRRTCNTPTESLTDSRTDDVDEIIADLVQERE